MHSSETPSMQHYQFQFSSIENAFKCNQNSQGSGIDFASALSVSLSLFQSIFGFRMSQLAVEFSSLACGGIFSFCWLQAVDSVSTYGCGCCMSQQLQQHCNFVKTSCAKRWFCNWTTLKIRCRIIMFPGRSTESIYICFSVEAPHAEAFWKIIATNKSLLWLSMSLSAVTLEAPFRIRDLDDKADHSHKDKETTQELLFFPSSTKRSLCPKGKFCWESTRCMLFWLWLFCGWVFSRFFWQKSQLFAGLRCWNSWAFSDFSV